LQGARIVVVRLGNQYATCSGETGHVDLAAVKERLRPSNQRHEEVVKPV
jgi:hypothetical protein